MTHYYLEANGSAYRVDPPWWRQPGPGGRRRTPDGSRLLVVPVIKGADPGFRRLPQRLRGWSRPGGNKLMPDDMAGGSMTLTNPGGLGTSMSVPRLMAGQGSIIATGAIAYPPEFSGVSKERLTDLGIAKIMTVTTYDHPGDPGGRVGEFLRDLDLLLQGGDGFYANIARTLGLDVQTEPKREPARRVCPSAPVVPPVSPRRPVKLSRQLRWRMWQRRCSWSTTSAPTATCGAARPAGLVAPRRPGLDPPP